MIDPLTPGGVEKDAEEIEKQILDLENALMRKELQRKEREKKKMIRIEKKKELERLIRQKRMARFDFSPDILLEMSMPALAAFYDRAKKELRDFWDIFH